MSTEYGNDHDEQRSRQRAEQAESALGQSREGLNNAADGTRYPHSLLGHADLRGRGNSSAHTAVMQRAQQTHGNRAIQRAIQRFSAPVAEMDTDDDIAKRIEAGSGGGRGLDMRARSLLEDSLDADLSDVRIHTDQEADKLARSMSAVAFTSGRDIFFRQGAYDPHTSEGMRLLAHETTHTIQQASGPVDGTPAAGGVSVSDPSDSFEQEAERTADAVMSGKQAGRASGDGSTASAGASGTAVQRFFEEPAPWLGQGGRHSDWNGMPSGPNIGTGPIGGPVGGGGGYDPAFDPSFPGMGGGGGGPVGGGGGYDPAFDPSFPFFNPTPSITMPSGGGGYAPGDPTGEPGFPFFNPTPNVPLPFHDMPGGGTGFGWQPPGKGEAPGPWAYYKGNGKQGYDMGVEGGFGAFHGEGDIAGVPVVDDLLYGRGKLGAWDDGQGGMRHGAAGDVGVAKWTINNGGAVQGDAEALTASAEASWGDSGATLGAQATLVGGSMTFNEGGESARLGLSEGVGMAGRLHWGKNPKTGNRQYGFGADVGPFSFDIKSEDPLRTLARTAAGPLADWALPNGNATNQAVDAAGEAWDGAKKLAGEGWDTAKQYGDDIGKYAVNAYDTASDYAGQATSAVSNAAGSAYDTVSDYAGQASSAVGDLWDQATSW